MKTILISLYLIACSYTYTCGQSTTKPDPVIEGGKVIVELVKALGGKKDQDKDPGCKGHHADVCITNESPNSITVNLEHRMSLEKREVVILPSGKECSLQAKVGVWTYDLKITGNTQSIRKGDMLIEGCHNLMMNIK